MKYPFNKDDGLIIVKAELIGPSGNVIVRLAFDTGATRTLINVGILVAIGYDPALKPERYQVTTGSGVEFVPAIDLEKINCLGIAHRKFSVLCHTLPSSTGVDGLLGLDFLENQKVLIDLQNGLLSIP